MKIPKELLA